MEFLEKVGWRKHGDSFPVGFPVEVIREHARRMREILVEEYGEPAVSPLIIGDTDGVIYWEMFSWAPMGLPGCASQLEDLEAWISDILRKYALVRSAQEQLRRAAKEVEDAIPRR